MKYCTATMDNLEELAFAEGSCFPAAEAASYKSVKNRIEWYGSHLTLAYENDTLVSYMMCMPSDQKDLVDSMYTDCSLYVPEGHWIMIYAVGTLPKYQGQKKASELMRYVINRYRNEERAGMVLTCKEEKIGFYKQFGFVNEGISASDHGGAVWYQMRLCF